MWEENLKKDRAAGIFLKDRKILLFHRFCDGNEYWVIPGGAVEPGETPEQAVDREIAEELSVVVHAKRFAFAVPHLGRTEHHFLIERYEGELKLGGPELARSSEKNQYILTWVEIETIKDLPNFYPDAAKEEILRSSKKSFELMLN